VIKISGLLNIIVLVSVVLSSFVTTTATTYQKWISAQEHIVKVKEALAKGDDATAYWEIESARIQEPDLPEPYILFAQLRRKQGRIKEAIAKLETGLQLIPDNPMLHSLLAELLWRTGARDRALIEAETAQKLGEKSADFYLLMGEIKTFPRTSSGYYQLSPDDQVKTRRESYDEALAFYTEALNIVSASDQNAIVLRRRIEIIKALRQDLFQENDPQFKMAKVLTQPRPDYTEQARANKVTGTITLAILITDTGAVGDAVTLTSLGYGLDEAAADAAKRMEFSPATKDGKPVASFTLVKITYQLL